MSKYVSKKKRTIIKERSGHSCEYCKIPEIFSFLGFEVDHIISLKHDGSNELDNLAWSCAFCNNFKGTDLGTFLLPSMDLIRFYNPRMDEWKDNFKFKEAFILPKTNIAKATIKILQLNHINRIEEREALIVAGLFPPFDFPFQNQ